MQTLLFSFKNLKKKNSLTTFCYFPWILINHHAQGAGRENEIILIIYNSVFPTTSFPLLILSTVIMCPSLSSFSLDHGKWKIVNGSHYEYGTRIIFTCNPGYYRVGPAHIQCLANGVWSWRNERPRCKSKWLLTLATKKVRGGTIQSFELISKLTWCQCNFVLAEDPRLDLKLF